MIQNSWKPLTDFERCVVKLLWEADAPRTSHFISRLGELRARSTGEIGCVFLAFSDKLNMERCGGHTFPYMAEAIDRDGVPIQIILFTDSNGEPFELEITRLDGADVIAPVKIEDLKIVKAI